MEEDYYYKWAKKMVKRIEDFIIKNLTEPNYNKVKPNYSPNEVEAYRQGWLDCKKRLLEIINEGIDD